ncbi:receptor-like serine/threonine-protein kinase ALE2 isoform X2 [Salvia splendens]|uniref:receptor-like serine/threonine-protein kinase ALE2 isoform X2 n=1 Tax=Salvia splendens TaxID=180675 RepID=UPI001C26805E|nr:receptor-like serine/threonine-protein kinase ALE2 isoform X2 [Salvia splendens]
MELVMLRDLGMLLQVWALACLLVIQGSAGIGLQPPFAVPSFQSAPSPQTTLPSPSTPTPIPIPFVPPPAATLDPALSTPPIPPSVNPPTPNPLVPPPTLSPDPVLSTPPIPPSENPPTPNPFVPPPALSPDPIPLTPPIPPADTPSKPTPNPFVPPPSSSPDLAPLAPPIPPSLPVPNHSVPPPSSSPDTIPRSPPFPPSASPPSKPTPSPFIPPPSSSPNHVPFTPPIPPSKSTPAPFVPPPSSSPHPVPFITPIPPSPQHAEHPPLIVHTPAPVISPSSSSPPDKQPHPSVSKSAPPTSDKSLAPVSDNPPSAIAPVSNVPAPRGMPESPPSSHSVLPNEPPSLPPVVRKSPSSPPAPPPMMSKKSASRPVVAPRDKIAPIHAPLSRSPAEAPTARNTQGRSSSASPPLQFSKSHSPRPHHSNALNTSRAPPPNAMPPLSPGSLVPSSPHPEVNSSHSPIPARSPASPSNRPKIPSLQPSMPPSASSRQSPNLPLLPPMRALPPPPPNTDCAPLTCTEPLTYGPPEAPCVCVLPIQVGLRLSIALYTFFPLVSELAAEVAAGVFMGKSQVRIMGANAAGDDTEKTVVLIDLLPLGEKFDDTTADITFGRFWHKQVVIKTSIFGEYDVLYVRYPGLPPSPPLPPSSINIIPSKPYPGQGNNGRTIQPLGVDVSRNQHKRGLNRSILAIIILSCFVALVLVCAAAWVFLFRDRQSAFRLDPTPPTTIRSLAKSSVSRTGSALSSPSFSLGSSMAAYTGSAKTYSSSEIDKATDFFNEANVLGEGGFGRVYSGVFEDGAKVAIKVLKRYDQHSGREFLAEVEMLSRLHHRNLVKLIGICVEDRTRCLVYELVPNGSVESHLHGIDKERSPLDWGARLKIALGAARALAYLHEDSSPRVIHRDFKASNILLEDDFTPKVSDFGLARAALDEDNKHISTRVMGTFGYVAPEYAMTGHLLVKSDVYSYGVVLLELLTGKKPVDMSQQPGQENLVAWARPLLTSREGLESMIDQSMAPDVPFDSIAKVAAIASMCVEPEVSHRPFMGEVVQALKLICSECDSMKEMPSRTSSQEDLSMLMEARNSTNSNMLPAPLLSPHSTVSDYDYLLDLERDLSMSELLSSSAMPGRGDSESFRRHSSSGPLRTSKMKPLWKTMRQLSRGSVSEHGVMFKLWHGSQ